MPAFLKARSVTGKLRKKSADRAASAPSLGAAPPVVVDTKRVVQMKFVNVGRHTVKLYRSSATKLRPFVTDIRPGSRTSLPVRYGDQFEVKVVAQAGGQEIERNDLHPKIYVSDLDAGAIEIHGNVPMSEFRNVGISFQLPDYDFNLTGLDVRNLDPKDVLSGLDKSFPVFERLDPINGVDYRVQAGNLILKNGFIYSGASTQTGTKGVNVTTNFSKFAQDFSVNVGGKGNIKGVDAGLDLGYNRFEETERKGEKVYIYSREQASASSPTSWFLRSSRTGATRSSSLGSARSSRRPLARGATRSRWARTSSQPSSSSGPARTASASRSK